MAVEISDKEFDALVINSDKPVLVDFWAPWCGPCQMLGPIIEEIGVEAGDAATVYKMNVDENPETAGKFAISAIPTVLVFEKGEVKNQFVGVRPRNDYRTALGL